MILVVGRQQAAVRLWTHFVLKEKVVDCVGSGVRISKNYIVTSGHNVIYNTEEGRWTLEWVKVYGGEYVDDLRITRQGIHGQVCSAVWNWTVENRNGALYKDGCDVGFLKCEADDSFDFLLPCSPDYLKAKEKQVAAFSYPDVGEFFKIAERDLAQPGSSVTWNNYQPSMKLELQEEIANGKTEVEAEASVKKRLLKLVKLAFTRCNTGYLICSGGFLIDHNSTSATHNCSTIGGSAGGAVCSLHHRGYMVLVHSGGSQGYDFNVGLSVDNFEFVAFYLNNVLQDIPGPDAAWNIDLSPFKAWLDCHICLIPPQSVWHPQNRNMKKRSPGSSPTESEVSSEVISGSPGQGSPVTPAHLIKRGFLNDAFASGSKRTRYDDRI